MRKPTGMLVIAVMTTAALAAAPAALALEPAVATIATAVATPGQSFDLKGTPVSPDPLWKKPLADKTVMQSFAFDPTTTDIYAAQVSSGAATNSGDLTITRMGADGTHKSVMRLKGFGHGISIAVERATSSSSAYIWLEGKVNPSSGYGTRVARILWAGNTTLTYSSAHDRTPTAVADKGPRTTIDHRNNLVVVRTESSTTYTYRAYELADITANGSSATARYTATTPRPARTGAGFAVHDSYIYLFHGDSYNVAPAPGNILLQTYKVSNPNSTATQAAVKWQEYDQAQTFKSLDFREPEGLSIYRPRSSGAGLAMGFASGPVGARLASIAAKTVRYTP